MIEIDKSSAMSLEDLINHVRADRSSDEAIVDAAFAAAIQERDELRAKCERLGQAQAVWKAKFIWMRDQLAQHKRGNR